MATYAPLGRLLLAECLAKDPFGEVYRGLERDGSPSGQDVLVRRYHPETLAAGLTNQVPEIRRALVRLGNLKAFQGCHLLLEDEPHLVWPHTPGRSLAQVLSRAEREGLPFGADQALFLGWALAHHISQLHRADLPLGFLTPHRVWVGFDGSVQLLDAPTIQALAQALPSLPAAEQAMGPYRQGPTQEGLAHDLFQLGALLFEMLTHHPLPVSEDLEWVLADATLPGLDAEARPMPSDLMSTLRRLLGLERPFASLEQLEQEVESILFDGAYNPSTFGLAFAMQTLFRAELETEAAAMQEEHEDSGIFRTLAALAEGSPELAQPTRSLKIPSWIAVGLLLLAAGGAFAALRRGEPPPAAVAQALPAPSPAPRPPHVVDAPATEPTPEAPARLMVPSRPTRALPAVPSAPAPQPPATRPIPAVTVPLVSPPPIPNIQAPAVQPVAPVPVAPLPSFDPPRLLGAVGTPGGPLLRVRVFVDETGCVRQALVIPGHGKGAAAEQKAYAAAMGARFSAARRGGQPVREWTEIPVAIQP